MTSPRRQRTRPAADPRRLAEAELRRMAAVRMELLDKHPFWGYLLLQLRLVPAPDLEAFAATDTLRHIWFNPALTRHLDHARLGFLLVHEAAHQLLQNLPRRAGRNPHRWNMATDYAINRMVHAITDPSSRDRHRLYQLPEAEIPGLGRLEVLLDARYDGMPAEIIYEHLCSEELHDPIHVTLALRTGGGDTGDGVTLRFPNLPAHGGIDIHLPDHLSEPQRETLRERVHAALESWSARGSQGDIPGDFLREAGFLEPPRVPWQRILHRFADLALARDEYSRARPNRKYLEFDAVVPGLHSEQTAQIVVALDTSGSMGRDELTEVARELRGIARETADMLLIVADCAIHDIVPFDQFESYIRRGRFKGGGGTDHRPVFEYLERHPIQPTLFIGLSDLYSHFPERAPPFPVLWLVPESHGTPPWGEIIHIPRIAKGSPP